MDVRRLLAAGVTVVCLAVAVAGCTATAPVAEPSVTATAAAAAPTPTPVPTAITEPVTCDTVFDNFEMTRIQADGLTFRGPWTSPDLDALAGAGALRCTWIKPGSDLVVRYAQWPSDLPTWEVLRAQLLTDNYIQTSDLSVVRPISEFDSALTYRDGLVYYTSPSSRMDAVTGLR